MTTHQWNLIHMEHSSGTKFYRVLHCIGENRWVAQWGKMRTGHRASDLRWAEGQMKVYSKSHDGSPVDKIWEKQRRGYDNVMRLKIDLDGSVHQGIQHGGGGPLRTELSFRMNRAVANEQQPTPATTKPEPEPESEPEPELDVNHVVIPLATLNQLLVKAAAGKDTEVLVELASVRTLVEDARGRITEAEDLLSAIDDIVFAQMGEKA